MMQAREVVSMSSATPVPLSEYLKTVYRPDCDYLEGDVKERTLGERPHAKIQSFFCRVVENHEDLWHVVALPEQRVQVRPNRYRIADVCVVRDTDPDTLIVTTAPLLCIEILSSEDTLASTLDRVNDYAAMGVEHIWVIDPWKRLAYYGSPNGYRAEAVSLSIPGTPITISVPELFARLDRK